jgi:hypothetical protein
MYIHVYKGCWRLIENTIASRVFEYVVGNNVLMALFVIFIVVVMLLAIKAGKVVILMLLIPLIMTLTVSTALIEIPKYIVPLVLIIAGFIFGGAILAYAFR